MIPNPEQIKAQARAVGFHLVGIAAISRDYGDRHREHLQQWLAQGYQGDMEWMANPKRLHVLEVFPAAQAVISLGLNYYTPHQRPTGPEYAKISRYGWGRDYHRVLGARLKALCSWLTSQDDAIETRFYVDTGPVSDKIWAQRAGLGWIGKNGNVISRSYGSWIFLGEILINQPLQGDRPHLQHCGTCCRCLDACPTGAIVEPFVVDSRQCIAYHTIENRNSTLPAAIAAHLQGWVAGCDICQDVCPWNQSFAQPTEVEDFQPYEGNVAPTLQEIANLTDLQWQKRFPASALRRIKLPQLKRNAHANLENNQ